MSHTYIASDDYGSISLPPESYMESSADTVSQGLTGEASTAATFSDDVSVRKHFDNTMPLILPTCVHIRHVGGLCRSGHKYTTQLGLEGATSKLISFKLSQYQIYLSS